MNSSIIEADGTNFEFLTSHGICLIDFWAPWCGPCKTMNPILEGLSSKFGDRVKIAKVDIESNPKLAKDFSIRSLPTVVLMKDGEVVRQMVGTQSLQKIVSEIEKM